MNITSFLVAGGIWTLHHIDVSILDEWQLLLVAVLLFISAVLVFKNPF